MDGQEARLWLMAAQGQAEPASSSEGWQRLKQLLLDGAAPSRACKQLLQVACEERPDLVRLHCFAHLHVYVCSRIAPLVLLHCRWLHVWLTCPAFLETYSRVSPHVSSVQVPCLTVLALHPAILACCREPPLHPDLVWMLPWGQHWPLQVRGAGFVTVRTGKQGKGGTTSDMPWRQCWTERGCRIIAPLTCTGGCPLLSCPCPPQSQVCLLSQSCLCCL